MRLIWSQSHVTLLILGRSCVTHKPLSPFVFLCVEHLQDFRVDSELQIYVLVQKMLPRIILILLSYATPTVNLKDVRTKIFQHGFFSETFTSVRSQFSDAKNAKKLGGHQLRFGENMPGRWPKIWKNRASLANKASVCKPQNIAIKSLKWNVLCQILFKWPYQVTLVNWWGFSKNKFAFSDHSFTRLAAARWQDTMSRGQKSWIFFTSHINFFFIFVQLGDNCNYNWFWFWFWKEKLGSPNVQDR